MMNQATYVKLQDLRKQGWTIAEITAETGFHPEAISLRLRSGEPPTRRRVPDEPCRVPPSGELHRVRHQGGADAAAAEALEHVAAAANPERTRSKSSTSAASSAAANSRMSADMATSLPALIVEPATSIYAPVVCCGWMRYVVVGLLEEIGALATTPMPCGSGVSAMLKSRWSRGRSRTALCSRSSCSSKTACRALGAMSRRSFNAATSRRVTWGDAAPARRISSKAR